MFLVVIYITERAHIALSFIDPSLEHDLQGPKPWALYVPCQLIFACVMCTDSNCCPRCTRSPLITTMPHFVHTELSTPDAPLAPFPPPAPNSIKDDTKLLCRRVGEMRRTRHLANGRKSEIVNGKGDAAPQLTTASKRRTYFANTKNRREITFGPEVKLSYVFRAYQKKTNYLITGRVDYRLLLRLPFVSLTCAQSSWWRQF